MSSKVGKKAKNTKVLSRSIAETILLQFPLYVVVMILPLITRYQEIYTGLGRFDWYPENAVSRDFFLYYKQWIFVLICAFITLIIIFRAILVKGSLKFHKVFLPLMIYTGLVILSTVFSDYRIFGLKGMAEQFENVFSVVGYAIVAYYVWLVVETPSELRVLLHAFAIGSLILGLIGMFQSLGLDIFYTDTGKTLITGNKIDKNLITPAFEKARTYITLYNPNYVGVYTVMTISLFSVLFLMSKKVSEYILYYLVILTSLFSLCGAQFKAGLVYLFVVLIVIAITLRKQLLKRWYLGLAIIATFFIAFVVTNNVSNGAYTDGIVGSFNQISTAKPSLESIDTGSEGVIVKFKGNVVTISVDESRQLQVVDSNNQNIGLILQDYSKGLSAYKIDDSRFEDIILISYDEGMESLDFYLCVNDTYWGFWHNTEEDTYLYYNRYGVLSPIITPKTAIFDGHESFGSGRGYIWSRTIPLLLKYPILGSGADTFIIAFPQHDFVGQSNFGFAESLITKPHCMYLQIAVQSGVLSVICFLAFFVVYAIQSIKLYIKNNFHTIESKLGLAFFIAVVGFLMAGVTNDSSICVSPVFWVVVGMGITANRMVKKTNNKEVAAENYKSH